jgi:hypothetical protein
LLRGIETLRTKGYDGSELEAKMSQVSDSFSPNIQNHCITILFGSLTFTRFVSTHIFKKIYSWNLDTCHSRLGSLTLSKNRTKERI